LDNFHFCKLPSAHLSVPKQVLSLSKVLILSSHSLSICIVHHFPLSDFHNNFRIKYFFSTLGKSQDHKENSYMWYIYSVALTYSMGDLLKQMNKTFYHHLHWESNSQLQYQYIIISAFNQTSNKNNLSFRNSRQLRPDFTKGIFPLYSKL
jgi:hypothetical protein